MKAIGQDRNGSPDVLELKEFGKPGGSHAARLPGRRNGVECRAGAGAGSPNATMETGYRAARLAMVARSRVSIWPSAGCLQAVAGTVIC